MLDLHQVRNHPDEVAEALRKRGLDLSLDRVLTLDEKRRSRLTEVEQLKKTRNDSSRRIGQIMKSGGDAGEARE